MLKPRPSEPGTGLALHAWSDRLALTDAEESVFYAEPDVYPLGFVCADVDTGVVKAEALPALRADGPHGQVCGIAGTVWSQVGATIAPQLLRLLSVSDSQPAAREYTKPGTRKLDDGARIVRAIKQVDGKRLQYRESVDNLPYLPQPKGQLNAPFNE